MLKSPSQPFLVLSRNAPPGEGRCVIRLKKSAGDTGRVVVYRLYFQPTRYRLGQRKEYNTRSRQIVNLQVLLQVSANGRIERYCFAVH